MAFLIHALDVIVVLSLVVLVISLAVLSTCEAYDSYRRIFWNKRK